MQVLHFANNRLKFIGTYSRYIISFICNNKNKNEKLKKLKTTEIEKFKKKRK